MTKLVECDTCHERAAIRDNMGADGEIHEFGPVDWQRLFVGGQEHDLCPACTRRAVTPDPVAASTKETSR